MNTTVRPEPPVGYRWAVLLFISLAMFGNYYLYDTIAPVADLMKSQLGFTDERIGLLYSAYSWGAVLILLPGGVFIDRYGTRKATMLFGVLCAIAGFLTFSDNWYVMLAGRTLLSAAEALIVAITAAIAKWFRGKELAFAMGINLTIARLGQIAADWSPTWMRGAYDNWKEPLVIGAFLGMTCVVGAVVYWILEVRAEQRYTLAQAGGTDKLVLADIFRFNRSFWIITALCVTFYAIIFPFRSFAIKYFIEAHAAERDFAGQLNSVLPFAAMIATPLFGLLVDKIGKRATLMAVGTLLLLPVFPLLAYTQLTLYVPVAMLGIAFSLIPAIMWPSVAYIVEQNRLGSAYALMFLLQQAIIAGVDWLVGRLNDNALASAANPAGYLPMLWVFTLLGAMALAFAFMLWRYETGPQGHGLETIKA
ncbi:MAG TPA: MFS transporter [Candidatus Xenobia bacterium]|nr:MFS transporter [Candidatus Xenobia bacterium]